MRIGILIVGISFLLFGCNNDAKEVSDFVKEKVETGETGSFAAPISQETNEITQVLMQHYWIVEFYIDPENSILARSQKGRWFQFSQDGTFKTGQWEEQLGYGSWFFTTRDGKYYLTIDNVDNSMDAEYEVQDINNAGDALSWLGQKGGKDSGAIIKMIQLWSMPTKKQFGVNK